MEEFSFSSVNGFKWFIEIESAYTFIDAEWVLVKLKRQRCCRGDCKNDKKENWKNNLKKQKSKEKFKEFTQTANLIHGINSS